MYRDIVGEFVAQYGGSKKGTAALSKETRERQIDYIHNNVDKLQKADRITMLTALVGFLGPEKITEKGMGSQIRYSDLSNDVVVCLSNFIRLRLSESMETFVKHVN